jgi:hypothetical protein
MGVTDSTSAKDNRIFEFGPFRLDPAERLLLRDKPELLLAI